MNPLMVGCGSGCSARRPASRVWVDLGATLFEIPDRTRPIRVTPTRSTSRAERNDVERGTWNAKSSAPRTPVGTLGHVSDSGFWYVGHAPDGLVAELRPAISEFAGRVERDRGVLQAIQAWQALPASVHGPEPGTEIAPTAHEFLDAFWSATADSDLFYACALDDHEDATWDLSEPKSRLERSSLQHPAFPRFRCSTSDSAPSGPSGCRAISVPSP